jgi:hypothetical protein
MGAGGIGHIDVASALNVHTATHTLVAVTGKLSGDYIVSARVEGAKTCQLGITTADSVAPTFFGVVASTSQTSASPAYPIGEVTGITAKHIGVYCSGGTARQGVVIAREVGTLNHQ